jgi:hypothetical protein
MHEVQRDGGPVVVDLVAECVGESGEAPQFLKHGAKNANDIEMVAPTGFEPVYESGHVFANS